MTGVELIAKERQEQIEKHGWTLDQDAKYNLAGELIQGAIYSLTGNDDYFPKDWSRKWKNKMTSKSALQQYIIAGALIAAEIDRIQADVKTDSHV